MDSLDDVFGAAIRDRSHGAAEIEGRLIDGLLARRGAWIRDDLRAGAVALLDGQPAMANLRSLSRRLGGENLDEIEAWLRRRASTLDELPERLGAAAWTHLEGSTRLVTLSRSSAVAAVLEHVWRRGWRGETVVLDGSPAGRGVEQAAALARLLSPVRSQPDATAPSWLDGRGCLVVIGADAISSRRLVNACGTAALVELAGSRSIPVLAVADTGKDIPDADIDGLVANLPKVEGDGPGRCWPVFDVTPSAWVTTRIHE